MLRLLSSLARAGGTTPEDRVELQAEVGLVTDQAALLAGVGAGLREGPLALVGSVGFGARGDWFDANVADQPGFGLATVAVTVDDTSGPVRLGASVLADMVLIDADEEQCVAAGCRHGWFWGMEEGLELGFGIQPAYGLRITNPGTTSAAYALFLGIQPHYRQGSLWITPRIDLASFGRASTWSLHTWAGRYGAGFGLGRRLSRDRRAPG